MCHGLAMVKLVFCLRRRPELTREEFQRIWLDEHGPLVRRHAEAIGMRRYVQSHTRDSALNPVLAGSRGAPEPYDGVAELWFDSEEALVAAATSPEGTAAGAELHADEQRFIDHAQSPIFLVAEHELVGGDA